MLDVAQSFNEGRLAHRGVHPFPKNLCNTDELFAVPLLRTLNFPYDLVSLASFAYGQDPPCGSFNSISSVTTLRRLRSRGNIYLTKSVQSFVHNILTVGSQELVNISLFPRYLTKTSYGKYRLKSVLFFVHSMFI